MSAHSAPAAPNRLAPDVRGALEAYYTRYYRDTLGLPTWREHVAVRLDDAALERRRVARLEQVLGRSLRGLRLLDVGCGTGGFLAAAGDAGARALGVDAVREAAVIAGRRVEGARVTQAAAEALPFADEAFDVVRCYSTLEHVADPGRTLGEMVRVLAPRGVLYLHVPHRWACTEGHYKVFWIPGLRGWGARAYLMARGRPTGFLASLHPQTRRGLERGLHAAGARVRTVLADEAPRRSGGPLWPAVRAYYRLTGIRPSIELIAERRRAS